MSDDWTLASLRVHFDQRFADAANLAAARDAHVHEVLDDLHRDISRVADAAPNMLSKDDYAPRHAQLEQKIDQLAATVSVIEGTRRGSLDTRALVLALVAAVIAVGSFLIGFGRL